MDHIQNDESPMWEKEEVNEIVIAQVKFPFSECLNYL